MWYAESLGNVVQIGIRKAIDKGVARNEYYKEFTAHFGSIGGNLRYC